MFLVRTPPGFEAERRYVLDVVLGSWWGNEWRHLAEDRPDWRIEVVGEPGARGVTLPDVFFGMAAGDWLTHESLPRPGRPIRWVGAVPDLGVLAPDERLPVLLGGASTGPCVEIGTDEVRIDVDVFGSAFFMLSRYEERVLSARDEHDRFPLTASLAHREGFLRLPIVDAYVELLRIACHVLWPGIRRRLGTYEVRLTHDVDHPLSTTVRSAVGRARQFAGDVLVRRDLGLAARRARALIAAGRGNHDPDPHNTFDFLMDVSERHGLRSAFYFLARDDNGPEADGDLWEHPWVRRMIGHVHQRGHEVGLHAGFGTYLDCDRTAEEFARFRKIAEHEGVDQDRWGGRQHYLQWANPQTWRNWSVAGLDYDCTVGFSEAVGFRTGTCRDYSVFDLLERLPLDLVEQPFQVMDVTLFGSMALTADGAREATLEIARQCRRFGGVLGILWHNDSLLRTGREKRWYASLVESVVAISG